MSSHELQTALILTADFLFPINNFGTVQWNSSISETIRNEKHFTLFMLRMTDTMTSKNINLSSLDTLYTCKRIVRLVRISWIKCRAVTSTPWPARNPVVTLKQFPRLPLEVKIFVVKKKCRVSHWCSTAHNIVQCWGYLISSAPIVHVSPLKTPCGLVILFITNSSHVTTIIHNYFLSCVTTAQLTNTHTFVTKVTYNTLTRIHWLRALH
jgi:hypothetical protein